MKPLATAAVALLCACFMAGLIYLLALDFDNDNKAYDEKCKQIAKLAGVTEYKVDYSTCYLLKDGKIEVVK